MAGPPKRNRKPSNSSTENDSDSEQHYLTQEVQVDFEGRNPEAQDFHGIKQLLKQLFLKAHVDLSQMTDLLIQQSGVGSVLKQTIDDDDDDDEDDDMAEALDVYGITSVLNLHSNKETPCIQQLLSALNEYVQKFANKETQELFKEKLMSGEKIGLLINERFVNIPLKIADPLLTSLGDELNKIKKKEQSYEFDYFLMICKMYKPKLGNDILFSNPEEQIFYDECDGSLEFNVSSESDTGVSGKWSEDDVEMIPYRRLILFKAQKLPSIIQKVKQFVA